MEIDVKKVAELARLDLTLEEEAQMEKKLQQVLSYFQNLVQVPTNQVEPLVTPVEISFHYREDQVEPNLTQSGALSNAPDRQGFLFRVPPVIDK